MLSIEEKRARWIAYNKKYKIEYTANCIICGKEFSNSSCRPTSRKSETCGIKECVSKLKSIRLLSRRPQDEESKRQRLIDRISKRTRKQDNGCEIYDGPLRGPGYRLIVIDGKSKIAHRVIYELYNGPIPKGMVVMHTCDCRACIAKNHLILGTQKQNLKDMKEKGRSPVFTKERRESISKRFMGNKINLGRKPSEETKNRMSESHKKNKLLIV